MHLISNLILKLAAMLKEADAERNLKTYLGTYLRPEFIKGLGWTNYSDAIDLGSIFRSMNIKTYFDAEEVLQDLVDRFISHKKGEDIRALLRVHSAKFGEEAKDLISSIKALTDDQRELVKRMTKDLGPLASKYIRTDLEQGYKEWLRRHEKETPMTENDPEPSIPPEHEIEEEAKKKQEWEEGLIKDTLDLINRKFPKEDHRMMKMILKDIFLSKHPKSQKQLAKELNVDESTITRHRSKLQKALKEFYTAQGLGGKFLEEGGLVKKEIVIPEYTEFLKDDDNYDDFMEFMEKKQEALKAHQRGVNISERSIKILNALAEGLDAKEVANKVQEPYSNIVNLRFTHFTPWYKEWYEEKVEEIRKAYIEENIMATTVRVPYEKVKEKEEETSEEAMAIHKKIVDKALKDGSTVVLIGFHSEYENQDVLSGRKDPAKDPAHFRFESYIVMIDESRMAGKGSRSVEYRYHQKLNDDGTFIGRGDSLLKLDGDVVKDGLKEEIDNYVENKIKPEGMFPHAHFATMYKNVKGDKVYKGVRKFVEHFRGILTWDLVHKQRMDKWEELQIKKQLGPGISQSDTEKVKETLLRIRQELQVEKSKRTELRDHERIVKLEKQEKEFEEALRGKDTLQKDLEEHIQRENEYLESIKLAMKKISDSYGAFGGLLPKPKREEMLKLLDIFKEYKVDSPNPNIWLEPKDLEVLARVLKATVDASIEKDIKDIKEEGEARNKKIHEIAEKHADTLSKAVGYFKAIPEDLKERRDEFKKKHPEEYNQISKKKDMLWVDNKERKENVIAKVRKTLLEKKEVEHTEKERGVKIIEKSKYKSLEVFLEHELDGLDIIAQTLEHASLTPKPLEASVREKITGEISRSESELKKMHSTLEEMTKAEFLDEAEISEEDAKKIEEARTGIPELARFLRMMKDSIIESQKIPALSIARVLQHKIDYFSGLYSKLAGILWFRDKPIINSVTTDLPEADTGKLEVLRGRVMHDIGILTSLNIFNRNSIKAKMLSSRNLVKKFIETFYIKKEASMPYSLILGSKNQIVYYRQAASEFEKAQIKTIFPSDELFHAEHLIKTELGASKDKKTRALAPVAQEELDKILGNVSEAYKSAFTPDRIKALAKRDNIPFEQASVRLKRLEDAVAKAALGGFILKWKDHLRHENIPKTRSELGNKPGSDYNKIGDYVERHIPELFELSPAENLPEEPSRGIPTPTKIRELIEEQFSKKERPEEHMTQEERGKEVNLSNLFFDADYFHGGGKGGKSKGRKKPVKNPPVSGVHEELKAQFLHLFKTKTPKEIIADNYMHLYSIKMKDFIKNLKEDEYVEVDAVIDGFVHMLKNVYHMILSLKVEPSTALKMPPASAPMFTGKPDIPIDSAKEAEQVFNKLVEVYKWVNFYLEPDKVGIPPENLKNLTSHSGIGKKYLPSYLLEWYDFFTKKESGLAEKKASFPMSLRIMTKFAGLGIQIEQRTEKDFI
jgi:hypothetical protein